MSLRIVEAGVVCGGLVALDLLCRSLRIRFFLVGVGRGIRLREAVVLTAFGDAASAVTPLRAGGSAARLLGLGRAGVPVPVAAGVLALELASYLAVVSVAGSLLFWGAASGWAATAAAALSGAGVPRWAFAAGLLCVVAIGLAWARHGALLARVRVPDAVRGALGWPLLASVPLAVLSVACRVSILVVIVRAVLGAPAAGDAVRASYALIFGQLVSPTPSGAGAVELAFASGAAGELGGLGPVFVLWRACTVALPVALGFGLAVPVYGAGAVRQVLRARRRDAAVALAPVAERLPGPPEAGSPPDGPLRGG